MQRKPLLIGALALAGALLARRGSAVVNDISEQYKAGEHSGEVKQLAVDLQFSGASGSTTTNAQGIFYNFWGITLSEPKIYPTQYWGTVPLYFFGQNVGATVTVTNNGPRATEKLRITTQVYVLNTDGGSGVKLAQDRVSEFSVAKGETKVVDASFTPQFVPGADSGLDRVVILVQHPNEGGGPGSLYPALIMAKEAVLCPPAIEAQGKAKTGK
jgi:hypothetical protein